MKKDIKLLFPSFVIVKGQNLKQVKTKNKKVIKKVIKKWANDYWILLGGNL